MEPSLQQAIYRDWGIYYKSLGRVEAALNSFEASVALQDNDFRPLLERSICKMEDCDIKTAKLFADECLKFHQNKVKAQLQKSNCIYEENDFEQSLLEFSNTCRTFPKSKIGKNNMDLSRHTIDKAIGHDTGSCLNNLRGPIKRLQKSYLHGQADKRPLWKILKEKNECDVVSIRSIAEPILPPIK